MFGRSISDLQPQMELPDLAAVAARCLWRAATGTGAMSGLARPLVIRSRILPSRGPDGKTGRRRLMLSISDAAKRVFDIAEADCRKRCGSLFGDPEPEPAVVKAE